MTWLSIGTAATLVALEALLSSSDNSTQAILAGGDTVRKWGGVHLDNAVSAMPADIGQPLAVILAQPLWLLLLIVGSATYMLLAGSDGGAASSLKRTGRLVVAGILWATLAAMLLAVRQPFAAALTSLIELGAWLGFGTRAESRDWLAAVTGARITDTFLMPLLNLPVGFVVVSGALLLHRALATSPAAPGTPTEPGAFAENDTTPAAGPATGHVSASKTPHDSELLSAVKDARAAFLGVAAFSFVINVLMLTGALFMLEVYDRVLPGRSVPTLVVLAIITAGLFVAQGLLDTIRGRLLIRIARGVDLSLGPRIFDLLARQRLAFGDAARGDPSRDLDNVRSFLSGQGPTALFDLPWMPFYIFVIFLFHPWLGWTALAGAAVLVTLTFAAGLLTRNPTAQANRLASDRQQFASSSQRNAEVLQALGMHQQLSRRWISSNAELSGAQQRISDIAAVFGATTRTLRMMLQSAVLGVGAYLVINDQASAGIIIAASILTARALAPVDLAIANWRGFTAARQSWSRLDTLLKRLPVETERLLLPAPTAALTVEGLMLEPPGVRRSVLVDISFSIPAGNALAVIGPSASGKSSLARALVGVWQPIRGRVRLDGASLTQWSSYELGRHIGYVPQDVELFEGSVAENIARFALDATAEEIIAAATSAGAHDMITALPQGYETGIGENGNVLSSGQRQRLALARALFRDPFLVVLDEPNSNLDAEGDVALLDAINRVKARGGIVIVVAHRRTAIANVDLVLALSNGRRAAFGPREEVLSQVLRPPSAGALKIVGEAKP